MKKLLLVTVLGLAGVLALLLTGCGRMTELPPVHYHSYCTNDMVQANRAWVLDCIRANRITSTESNSPEDVISTCAYQVTQLCPKTWSVKTGFDTWTPCDFLPETGPSEVLERRVACLQAGWVPQTKTAKAQDAQAH